jgi:hypothetical protein
MNGSGVMLLVKEKGGRGGDSVSHAHVLRPDFNLEVQEDDWYVPRPPFLVFSWLCLSARLDRGQR